MTFIHILKYSLIFLSVIMVQVAVIMLALIFMVFASAFFVNMSGLAIFCIFFTGAFLLGMPFASAAWAWEDMVKKPVTKNERLIWCAIVAILWIPGMSCYIVWRSRKGKQLIADTLPMTLQQHTSGTV